MAPAGAGDAPACFCERWLLTYGNDARAGPQSRPLEGRVPGSAARAARCRGASGALTKRPFLAELRRQLARALPRGRRKVGEAGGAGPPVWACELRDPWVGRWSGDAARVARDLDWPALPPHLRLPDLRSPELKAVTVPRSSIRQDREQAERVLVLWVEATQAAPRSRSLRGEPLGVGLRLLGTLGSLES